MVLEIKSYILLVTLERSKFEPGPVTLPSLQKAIPQSKDLSAKSMAKLLGQHSGTALAGLKNKHKPRE